ncbi:MAG: DUF4097 family beta strand repeat protein [Lachnospiraceae bacterium]|nr:DUF4097 family beta strand repeat protein [Lachnospiraceae bacterium]
MSKQDFLWQLERNLVMGAEEKSEVMRYYTEYFEEAGPENEEAVIAELGDPKMLAEKLNAECETQAEEPWTEDPGWQEAIDEAEMALREAEIDVREAEIDVNEAKIEVDAARAEWEAAKKDVEEAKRVVSSIMAELQQAFGEAAETLEQELSEAEDELTEAEDAETDADDALRNAMEELRDAEQELKDAERELRSAQREAASARRGNRRENSRNADNIIDESLRFAERTTRSVFTSLKDIFGGGSTEKELHEFCDHDMEPFHSIRVDVENCPITVVPSEDDKYGVEAKFFVGDQGKWEVRVDDGILTVKKQYSSKRVWIEFGFSGHSEKNREYVRIYLPKVAMEIIELDTSNASVQVEGVSVHTLIADTSNAMIRIEDTKVLDELKADTSNGAICLSRVEGEDITLDTSNGAINLEQVTGRKMKADTSNGSIEALLVGSEHEYSIHADTSNAKIHVDGQVRGDEYHSHGGSKGVWLDTSNGRITIGFVSRS